MSALVMRQSMPTLTLAADQLTKWKPAQFRMKKSPFFFTKPEENIPSDLSYNAIRLNQKGPDRLMYLIHQIPREQYPHLKGKDYKLGSDWFTWNAAAWVTFFKNVGWLKGEKPLKILEIGSFEGRSTVWMLENIAKHRESQIYAIDLFEEEVPYFGEAGYGRLFQHNIKATGHAEKVVILKGDSGLLVPSLYQSHQKSFDLIFIDGSHKTIDVLADATNSFRLLKKDGYMIFDDYALSREDELPSLAIDSFIACVNQYKAKVRVLYKNYQCALQKIDE